MRRALLLALICALGPSLTVLGSAQGDAYDWSGELSFDETAYVGPGETLRVAPGTSINGTARIEVQGSLVVEGSAEQPVEFSLPVVLLGEGVSSFRHTRFIDVNETALNVSSGEALLENVTFEGNLRAMLVTGNGRAIVRDGAFRDHVDEAILVEGASVVEISSSMLARNGRALAVYSASRVEIARSEFSSNGQHVLVDLWPWSVEGSFAFSGNAFLAPAPAAAPLPGIHLRHDRSAAGQPARVVEMRDNRIEGAAIGLRAEGRGIIVESVNDTFIGNSLGVSSQLATVTLRRPTFGNSRDVDGTSITLEDPTYLQEGVVVPPVQSAPRAWIPWAVAGAAVVILAAGGGFAVSRARRSTGSPASPPPLAAPRTTPMRPAHEASGPSPPPADPAPRGAAPTLGAPPARGADLAAPVSMLERRILEDILAHPGTSQRAVADRLGYTRQALHYHVKRLEARGLVDKTMEGRETRCAVPQEVARMLSTPAVTQTGSHEKA